MDYGKKGTAVAIGRDFNDTAFNGADQGLYTGSEMDLHFFRYFVVDFSGSGGLGFCTRGAIKIQETGKMKKLVVLSGSGISAESGIRTFRDMGGLWEKYDVTQVASPVAWQNNRELVLRFYNERRKALLEAEPNAAHKGLASLEKRFDVQIITQNVDDLHERAGSTKILHLHGELRKARCTVNEEDVYDIDGWELKEGDLSDSGHQLRPHIVWFGELVTAIEEAVPLVRAADLLLVIGTSLYVYPAAGLIHYTQPGIPVYVIDPGEPLGIGSMDVTFINKTATEGIRDFLRLI